MEPCKVCGATDLNLVDGFYYCVECGTQDVNIQETIVEQTAVGDGTFAHVTVKKFTTAAKDGVEMSAEWHKWHIFNFILAGLTDELIALGAKPSVKMKVLWIWIRYVKEFQVKDDPVQKSKLDIYDDDDANDDYDHDDKIKRRECVREDSDSYETDEEIKGKSKKVRPETFSRDIKVVTRSTLLTILYVALNLDRSDIQLSTLLRFINEGRLSIYNSMKFVPKELNIKTIGNWKSFILSKINLSPISIRALAMTCFKRLKLGVPLVPDLSKIVKNNVQELCLPGDVANLIFALMRYIPIDFIDVNSVTQKSLVRIPDYEGICMAYTLVALKMCFGLDGNYEAELSKEVDRINNEQNYLKSFKLGLFSEPSERLFSFEEWCQHLQFRKLILCKHSLPMSRKFNAMPGDEVFMEHLEKRKKRLIKLSDDVTMDILNKIKSDEESQVIPKNEFPVSLTPLTSYVEVIAQYLHDPDLKLLLCEDFTKYSIKYAIQDLKIPNFYSNDARNPIVGVSEFGKIFNNHIIGTLKVKEGDTTLVYVRNCQNKNWLKTKPPTEDHVMKENQTENGSDKESDHGSDSNLESSIPESEATHFTIHDKTTYAYDKNLEIKMGLSDNNNIFADNFQNMTTTSFNVSNVPIKEKNDVNNYEINTQSNFYTQDSKIESLDIVENREDNAMFAIFDPKTFNREKMIKDLIESAREKYKIPVTKESTFTGPRKRKGNLVNDEAATSEPKKKRTQNRSKPGEARNEINKLISTYYNNMHNEILNQVADRVMSVIESVNHDHLDSQNIEQTPNELETSNVDRSPNEIEASNILSIEENISHTNINTADVTENSQADVDPNAQKRVSDSEDDDQEVVEEFLKSGPNFDEKDYDIKQLYIKLAEDMNTTEIIEGLEMNPDIDKIIQKHIEIFSTDKCSLGTNKIKDIITDISDCSESDDDIPLSALKEAIDIEQEKKAMKREKLEPLIRDFSHVKEFKYWVRHYKSPSVVRSTDMAKKFDLELNENLPISFVLVIRECAAIVGCSMFSLYRNMQNIEEILIE